MILLTVAMMVSANLLTGCSGTAGQDRTADEQSSIAGEQNSDANEEDGKQESDAEQISTVSGVMDEKRINSFC